MSSKTRTDTWMPMFWGDYVRDTAHLNASKHGAYLMLIQHYWCTAAPLPDDDDTLWRVARCDSKQEWRRMRATIAAFFSVADGVWRHKRIDLEIANAADRVRKRAVAGKAGAEARWSERQSDPQPLHDGERNANAIGNRMSNAVPPQCVDDGQSQSQSQSQSQREKEKVGGGSPPDADFAFVGRVVRLKRADYDRWRAKFHAIPDFDAELEAADAYYSDNPPPKNAWFFPVSGWLNRAHQKIIAERKVSAAADRSW